MNFRCKFRHRRLIRRPPFPIRVQNFSDLATFSVDFCILYAECLPYFYFLVVWPTDLKSIPHASTHTSIIPARFEVDMTIHCRVIALLSADTSHDLVTLTFDLLTLNICHAWRVTGPTLPPSMKTLRLMRTRLLRMCGITQSVSRGPKTITCFVCSTPIFTMQLRWLYDESN